MTSTIIGKLLSVSKLEGFFFFLMDLPLKNYSPRRIGFSDFGLM